MEKPILDPEEWTLSFEDVKRLYICMWRKLFKLALLGGLLAFLYFGNRIPKFKAEASFKESAERTSDSENILKEMIGGMGGSVQLQATSIMKSNQILKPLVEKLGLQICRPNSDWVGKRFLKRYADALRAERKAPLSEPDPFVFERVYYEEKGGSFALAFTDRDHFTVYSSDRKREIGKGALGLEVHLQGLNLKFTLAKIPKNVKIGSFYPFLAIDWASAVAEVRSQIKFTNDPHNHSIIYISALHWNRHLAVQIANELMVQYQCYLKREYDHIAKEELAYFENKQEKIYDKMEQLFEQHAAYLRGNLQDQGFVAGAQEMEAILSSHQKMREKLLAIEVELKSLDEIEKGKKELFQNNEICQKIRELKQKKDFLELSLFPTPESSFEAKRRALKEIRDRRLKVENSIREIDLGQEITAFDAGQGLSWWASTIQDSEGREDLAEYLENYARLLSMQEKMVRECFFCGDSLPKELDGIDLSSADQLFLQYNQKLDATQASLRCFEQIRKEIPRPDFELASLHAILPEDPFCQQLIEEASSLELKLRDEKHRSSKERERWEEEMALHRNILTAHLDQLCKIEELNSSLLKEKMTALQKVSLNWVNQQISVLSERNYDTMKERRQSLFLEKSLIENKMEEIRSALAKTFPEKWRFEKWLEIKTEMVGKILDAITQVVEKKTVANHLHHVESKPLDLAIVPSLPQPPRLFLMIYLGAFALPFLFFSIAFLRQLFRGFPISLEKLKALRWPFLGPISPFCDGPSVETPSGPDLELLRQIALFSQGKKVISLIGGQGPDYSYALGENLARMSVKPILLRCDFLSKFRKENGPGLLQVWKGEIGELPIRKGKGFDYITSGGFTPFGTELIQSESFAQLIELLKKNYDWVFLFFQTPLSSAESIAALRLCDKAIVTVCGEQIEELTPFVAWAYDEDRCRLTFIAAP